MVRRLQLLCSLVFLVASTSFAYAVVNPTNTEAVDPTVSEALTGSDQAFTAEDFLELSPKKIREATGKKLTLKETIALKVAQKKVKKQMKRAAKGQAAAEPKSQLIALILVILVGALGIHRFYLGYTTIGIIQLLTLGGCGVWALIDLIRIAIGELGPADGSEYDPKL